MRPDIILCMSALGKLTLISAFINPNSLPAKTRASLFYRNRVSFAAAKDIDNAIFDAAEAAAVDAHDVSDAGIEGAAMERAVIVADELYKEQEKQKLENEISEAGDAEANFAHDLADAAAVEHVNEIPIEDSGAEDDDDDATLFDAEQAAAVDAHDVSDAGIEGAAMERAVIVADELYKEEQIKRSEEIISEVYDAEANFAHDLSDAAAVEHVNDIPVEDSFGVEDDDTALHDAEEAAAIDAHDVSDAGIEGAAMERAVIVADELYKEEQIKRSEEIISEVYDAEANFAHDLSDAAAVEHANDIPVEDSGAEDDDTTLFDAEQAAAIDAHDLSDAGIEGAAIERFVVMADELYKELQSEKKEEHENE